MSEDVAPGDGALPPLQHEVVDQAPVAQERLRSDARIAGQDVARLELRQQLPGRRDEQVPVVVPSQLAQSHPQMRARQAAEAGCPDGLEDVAEAHLVAPVALAPQRENGVGAEPHRSIHTQRRVNAEERVHERVCEMAGLGSKDVVVTAERHDPRVDRTAAELRQPVRVDAGTEHGVARRHLAGRAREAHARPLALDDVLYLVAEQKLAAGGRDVVGESPGHEPVVDDPRARHMQRPYASCVGLQFSQAGRSDQLEPRYAVRRPSTQQLLEPGQLGRLACDDHLAADVVRDCALVAVRPQRRSTLNAEPRLQRAGRVVHTRVDDAARASGLVPRDPGLLVEHDDPEPRMPRRERARDGKPDDSGPDDRDVCAAIAHGRVRRSTHILRQRVLGPRAALGRRQAAATRCNRTTLDAVGRRHLQVDGAVPVVLTRLVHLGRAHPGPHLGDVARYASLDADVIRLIVARAVTGGEDR
jgi:hypothetical protein